jgi:lysophospholipase L1-like esterase
MGFIGNLVLLSASLLVAALGTEVLLRVMKPQIFDIHPQGMYVADPSVGYLMTQGYAGVIERSEYKAPFTVNSLGLRGPPLRDRQNDTFRILILGDSMAFGFGVLDGEVFSARLEAILAERLPERDIQILNTSVPGFGTADQLAFLRTRGAMLDPDLVVVLFFSINDVLESLYPAAEWAGVRDGSLINRNAMSASEVPEEDWGGYGDITGAMLWMKDRSHLLYLVSNSLGYLALRMGLVDDVDALWGEDFPEEAGKITKEFLLEIAQEARRLGADPLFVYTTGQNYVVSERYELPRSGALVAAAAEDAEVPWIDVTPHFRGRSDRYDLFYALDGHWNGAGHRALAEVLADEMLAFDVIAADAGAAP